MKTPLFSVTSCKSFIPFFTVKFIRSLLVLLLLALTTTTGFARLGDSLAKLKEHFGKSPDPKSPKGMAVWFVESVDGPLVYTVTLNAQGVSIAEGIKPLKRAVLTQQIAQDFLEDQMTLTKDSKTARILKPGDKYEFAKQVYACGDHEWVLVDDARGILLIWAQGGIPSIMAVTREMMMRSGG